MNLKALDVAYYWSPREAAAILDYLDRLRDLVWETYSDDIIELRQNECESDADPDEQTDEYFENQRAFTFENGHDH